MTTSKSSESNVLALGGSHRAHAPGKRVRQVHGNTILDVSVQLPMAGSGSDIIAALNHPARFNSRQVQNLIGAKAEHVSSLVARAKSCGLTVIRRTAAHKEFGIVRLSGRYSAFKKFFPGLELDIYAVGKKGHETEIVGRVGSIPVQADLNIVGVYGFDEREVAHFNYRTDFKPHKPTSLRGKKPHDGEATFPTGLSGRGQNLLLGVPASVMDSAKVVTGFVSLWGANQKKMEADLAKAAENDGIKLNKGGLISVGVGGKKLNADYTGDATVEDLLDALQHRLNNPNGTCVVFVGGNSDDDFAGCGENAVAFKGVNGKPLQSLSISWGMAESNNTPQTLQRWARIFLAARLKGLIIIPATGDNGSTDGSDKDTPDAPASTPNGFGGAGVYIKVNSKNEVVEIGVWNDLAAGGGATGGGISETFDVQDYETGLVFPVSGSTGRKGHNASTLADIAAPACGPLVWWTVPQTKGQPFPVGGTSNAAPALAIKLGLVQSQLKNPIKDMVKFVFDNHAAITTALTVAGNNGDATYVAGPGVVYSVATGFGMLNFNKAVAVAKKLQDGVGA